MQRSMRIQIKRVYEAPDDADGKRVLVDRLWPRGLSKVAAKIDFWEKEVAPSHELRRWYGHDPEKWAEFKCRYFAELRTNNEVVRRFLSFAGKRKVTFLYGSKEKRLNNAVALKEYIESDLCAVISPSSEK